VCEVRLLVVGDSERRNLDAIRVVATKCLEESGGQAHLSCDKSGCLDPIEANIDDYDIIAIDDAAMRTDCGRLLIGSDIPVVLFSDLSRATTAAWRKAGVLISSIVSHAVARGNLREKIAVVTDQIEQTSRLIAAI
jgi:hypothetical protein